MVVLSNRALGASCELLVSPPVMAAMLRAAAAAARELAIDRWELELARWLCARAEDVEPLDVGEIAWTPEHFESQRAFAVAAVARAATGSPHASAFARWRKMIEAHPRSAIHVKRLWRWKSLEISGDIPDDVAERPRSGAAVGDVGAADLSLGG